MTSLNKGLIPNEVTEILNYDLNGERANTELKQLKRIYMDCEREKEQLHSDFSYYREGNIPKYIAGLFQFIKRTSLMFKVSIKNRWGYILTHSIFL